MNVKKACRRDYKRSKRTNGKLSDCGPSQLEERKRTERLRRAREEKLKLIELTP